MPSYTRTTWQDYPNVTTPITASRLNNMETGIVGANSIIVTCTSSTRPSSPFNGQRIYETDTRRSWTYVNSNWVPDDMVFTTEAARDAAIPLPYEGQTAYLTAPTVPAATGQTTVVPSGVQTIYNGSVWVCVTPVGAVTNTSGNVTSPSFTATTSAGTNPTVTLVTGTTAIVDINGTVYNSTNTAYSYISVSVSGATTLAASENNSLYYSAVSGSAADAHLSRRMILTGLTAGTNTFTMEYKVNTGTLQTNRRTLIVQGIA